MVSQVTKVINKEGFHMRPANMFVKEMTAFQSDVHLILNGKDINAKSIMNIMAGCIKCGSISVNTDKSSGFAKFFTYKRRMSAAAKRAVKIHSFRLYVQRFNAFIQQN